MLQPATRWILIPDLYISCKTQLERKEVRGATQNWNITSIVWGGDLHLWKGPLNALQISRNIQQVANCLLDPMNCLKLNHLRKSALWSNEEWLHLLQMFPPKAGAAPQPSGKQVWASGGRCWCWYWWDDQPDTPSTKRPIGEIRCHPATTAHSFKREWLVMSCLPGPREKRKGCRKTVVTFFVPYTCPFFKIFKARVLDLIKPSAW